MITPEVEAALETLLRQQAKAVTARNSALTFDSLFRTVKRRQCDEDLLASIRQIINRIVKESKPKQKLGRKSHQVH